MLSRAEATRDASSAPRDAATCWHPRGRLLFDRADVLEAGALADAESHRNGNKIRMLFEEWRALYGQVADLSREQLKGINGTLRFARANDSSEAEQIIEASV